MIEQVYHLITSHIRGKKKVSGNGWLSFNAVCCIHKGETQDKRMRGGLIKSPGRIGYSCFNCGFSAVFDARLGLSKKFKQLLTWFGVPPEEINALVLSVWRAKESGQLDQQVSVPALKEFKPVSLPDGAMTLSEWHTYGCSDENFLNVVKYVTERGCNWQDPRFMWTPKLWEEEKTKTVLSDRVIIPFKLLGKTIGWTSRCINADGVRYFTQMPPDTVFGLDHQKYGWKYLILVEGPFDALPIDGVALLGSRINATKRKLINMLDKQVILVPDYDSKGEHLIGEALECGWSVSLPPWPVKDVSAAVKEYGRLNVLKLIIENIQTSDVKIKLNWRMNERKAKKD